MAETKKKTEEEIPEQIPEKGEELISIRLPLTKDLQGDVFVRVNQRTWLIKRGETVNLPACAVEVLEHAQEAELEAMRYQMQKERTNL